MDDESRSDVVRTLVTLIISKHGTKPGRMRLEELGRQLILKYPFMKDDLGTGYVSTKRIVIVLRGNDTPGLLSYMYIFNKVILHVQ